MGTWGTGAFENDGAADWLWEVDEHARPLQLIRKTLSRVARAKPGAELDLDDCLEAVAAAELVAWARGHGSGQVGPADTAGTVQRLKEQGVSADDGLASFAASAVRRVAAGGELCDEWAGNAAWRRAMKSLADRLARPVAEVPTTARARPAKRPTRDTDDITIPAAVKALGNRVAWTDMNARGEPLGGMANAPLKERDVRLLARCTTLQGLGLYGKAVTSSLLSELTHLKLRWLRLAGTGIDDAAGPVLKRFGELTELRLPDTKVTDRIVEHLSRMKKLTTLDVSDTGITDRGAQRLARALPKCRVLRVD